MQTGINEKPLLHDTFAVMGDATCISNVMKLLAEGEFPCGNGLGYHNLEKGIGSTLRLTSD